jgi:type I restriction enzyme S subunit
MSETVHIPQLRFPEFSGDWNRVKIQKLLDDKSIISHLDGNHGALYPRSEEFTKEGVPYVTANDFINGKVDLKKCKCLPVERASQFKKGIAHNGDVLFAHNATVGPVALLETDLEYVVLSTTATYYRCDNNTLINKYLKVYLTSNDFVRQYSRVMSQSTRNQVPITTQRLFYINLPDKPEQQKIAAFLTAVDSKIEQLSKKQELLGEYKKGLMQQIFSQAIRFRAGDTPGQPLLPNGNSPSGSDFPNWEEKRLGDLCEITTGKLDANAMVEGGQYRFYTCAKEYYKIDDYAFDTDALIVSGNGANVGYIHHYQGKFNAYQRTYVLDSFTDNIIFVKFVLDEYLHKRIMKEKNEGNTPYIVMGTLTDMKINLPSFSEQTKIAIFLSSIDSKIEQVGKQLDESKQFKKALLQQMFV